MSEFFDDNDRFGSMNESFGDSDRFWSLADAVCSNTATDEESRELEQLLLDDPRARKVYIAYCQFHLTLGLELRGQTAGSASVLKIVEETAASNAGDHAPLDGAMPIFDFAAASRSSFPLPSDSHGFFGSVYHGAVEFFSHEVPFSFLVASVIFVLGALVGSWISVTHYTQSLGDAQPYVAKSTEPATTPAQANPAVAMVCQITGMVDVKWSDDADFTPPLGYAAFPVGRKLKLDAGLLEIAYKTGAKVILQGPCDYEIESADGGFLSLGKLTARVEKKSDFSRLAAASTRRDAMKSVKDDSRREDAAAKHSPPLFAVRTPTATVTDLGTEFGVEVDEHQATHMTVFQGEVEVCRNVADQPNHSLGRFKQGQFVGVDAAGDVLPREASAASKTFVRDFRKAAGESAAKKLAGFRAAMQKDPALAAYYAFDNEEESSDMLLNRAAATAGRMDGVLGEPGKPETKPVWADGFGAGRRALRFDAARRQVVRVPHDDALNVESELSVVAWIKARQPLPPHSRVIASHCEAARVGFQLAVDGPAQGHSPFSIQFCPSNNPGPDVYSGSVLPEREEWWQVAGVLGRGFKQFYLNGRLVDQATDGGDHSTLNTDLWIGATAPFWGDQRYWFDGLIGEIWIFKRTLSQSEVGLLYKIEKPVEGGGQK